MTEQEFKEINWHRGNVAKLQNGKEYLVKGVKGHGRYLLLYSLEYDARFVADYKIVDCRTSDYEEPEEEYLERKRQKQAEAEAKREAERQEHLRAKAERKRRNVEEQERIHREAVARKEAAKGKKAASKVTVKVVAPKVKEEPKPQKAEAPAVVKAEVPKPAKVEVPQKPASSSVETKSEEPAAEAPRKRVRQRIKVTSSAPVREKVEFFKKKK